TTWTPVAGDAVRFEQGPPKSLPMVKGVGAQGANVTPTGSVFISAKVSNFFVNFDCRPGNTIMTDISKYTEAVPSAFEPNGGGGSDAPAPSGEQASAPSSDGGKGIGGLVTTGVIVVVSAAALVLLVRAVRPRKPPVPPAAP